MQTFSAGCCPQEKYLNRHGFDVDDAIEVIRQFNTLNVAVVGDIIVDEYVDCDPVGMSLEDPTIVVSPMDNRKFVGGAGIVAGHAKKLGANVDFFSVTGADANGAYAQRYLTELDVNCYIAQDMSRPTTTKRRYRAANKTLLRVNEFKKHEVEKEISEMLFEPLVTNISKYDLVLFCDFSFGLLNKSAVRKLQETCLANQVPMAADSQTSSQIGDLGKFNNLLLGSPTEHEARITMKDTDSSLVKVSERLMAKLKVEHLIATMGESGALVLTQGDKAGAYEVDSLPALNKNPVDVAGAGDAMLVSSALALTVGASIWQAAYIGAIASACQVGRLGNLPLSADELITKSQKT